MLRVLDGAPRVGFGARSKPLLILRHHLRPSVRESAESRDGGGQVERAAVEPALVTDLVEVAANRKDPVHAASMVRSSACLKQNPTATEKSTGSYALRGHT